VRRSSRAVVAVVGTLLSLLVFFALFGVFLTQYVPVWMSENESTWAGQVQASMAQLQSNIEQQVVLGAPSVYATPFVMDSQGIPLFAAPTQGVLTFGAAVLNSVNASPFATYTPSVAYNLTGYKGVSSLAQSFPTGFVQMTLPNRYYVPQTYQLEDDAVIQSQSPSSQYVQFPPLLKVGTVNGNLSVVLEIVQFGGNSTQSYFQGTQDIYTTYTNSQSVSFNSTTTYTVTVSAYTHYPCAWWSLFNNTIRQNGLQSFATSTNSAGYCVSPAGGLTKVSIRLTGVVSFTYLLGEISISTGVGVA
jgi:hypothetical protein